MERERLDLLLVERGLAPSRAKAQALVLSGRVESRGARLDKPGMRFPRDVPLEVLPGKRFVSRGGHKLEGALRRFGIEQAGRDAIDVGASTGGFTQVLLDGGARRVIALDVGRGQLDWRLRNDPRVHPLEGVNARHLEPGRLPFRPSLAVVDVSFISLKLVLPGIVPCMAEDAEIVTLVKPQFEVGRGKVSRGGIVREPELHREVLTALGEFAAQRGWGVEDLCRSEIRGARGNQEFFLHLRPGAAGLESEGLRARVLSCTEPPGEDGR